MALSTRKPPPEAPATRRERVEARERAILDAAREVFTEHDYDDARIAEIARRAGIAEGTVYLYYRNKRDLTRALVDDLWGELTGGATRAVEPNAHAFTRLRQLARFHLDTILSRYRLLELTYRFREDIGAEDSARAHRRRYVAVFDRIFERGIDRGEIVTDTPLWICRDVFFGTLEHSARSAALRGEDTAGGAVDNLIEIFTAAYAGPSARAGTPARDQTAALIERLDQAVGRLERLGAPSR